MAKLALIGGHSLLGAEGEGPWRPLDPVSADGPGLVGAGEVVMLQRHGVAGYRTAARIDHRANLRALADAGCDRILAIGSVGGLKADLPVGSFVCPDDFIALHLGLSFSDEHGGERVPGFDPGRRTRVMAAWAEAAEPELVDGGVYWQAIGPRFETPAEIRLMSAHADLVGMTIASECVLAGELGIPYTAVCVVDNLANGVGGEALSVEAFEQGKARNRERLLESLTAVLPRLAAPAGEAAA